MAGILANSLTLKNLISYYLYGTVDKPDDYEARLRPDVTATNYASTKLQIDAPDFMANGPGRYANLSQVPLIQVMLNEPSEIPSYLAQYNLSGRTVFTVADLRAGGLPLSDIEMSLSQYQMDTGSSDYVSRGYIWSSELFKLNDDAIIDLSDPANPVIKNVNLRPFNDNFDYFSSNPAIQVSNLSSMNTVDPYAIGRTVEFDFEDLDAITKAGAAVGSDHIYSVASFQADASRWDAQYNGNIIDGFTGVFLAGNQEIRDSGILDYNLIDGGNVIYGTDADNVINGTTGYSNSLTVKHISAGVDVWFSSDSDPVNASKTVFPQDKTTIVVAGAGNDTVTTGGGNDTLFGGEGNDTLVGGAGEDMIYGGSNNDTIVGGVSADQPDDRTADRLEGGDGHDTYVVGGSFSNFESSTPRSEFYGTTSISRAWYVLSLKYIDTISDSDGDGEISASFTVSGQVYNASFALNVYDNFVSIPQDNRTWARYNAYEYMGRAGQWQIDTGADTGVIEITGRNSNGEKAQYEIIQAGYGSTNPLTHAPLVAIETSTGSTQRSLAASTEVFFDGTDSDDVANGGSGDDQLYGDGGNDTITGGSGSDYLEGNDGTDTLYGDADDDVLLGGAGNDTLYGGDGNDILDGEGGADVIYGGDGDDIIYIDAADTDFSGGDGYDTLVFNGSDDFVYSMATSGFESLYSGSGNDVLTGSDFDDEISAGDGDDQVYAGLGYDLLDGEGGNDTAIYGGTFADYAFERVDDHTISVTKPTGDMDEIANFENIHFTGDNTTLTIEELFNGGGNPPPIVGTPGDDQLGGTIGADTLDGGAGNDVLSGGDGSDTYIYRSGDGSDGIVEDSTSITDVDVLQFTDLNLADLSFSQSGSDLLVSVNGTNDVISIYWQTTDVSLGEGIEKILFADGMSADLYHGDTAWKITGTAGNDQISSPEWGAREIFDGGKGDDFLYGTAGGDVYLYASGDGNDEISDDVGFTDEGNTDILRFIDLNLSDIALQRSGDNLLVTVNGTGEVITIDYQFLSTDQNFGIESIEFADGSSLARADFFSHLPSGTIGTAGDDTLTGTDGDDVFDGGLGNDVLVGGNGSDTYLYRLGDGSDGIVEEPVSASDTDVLDFVDLNLADMSFSRSGGDLLASINGTSDVISVYWQWSDPSQAQGLEKILFANGMSADLYHGDTAWKLNGTDGNDQISSPLWGAQEIFAGGKGDDFLYGSAGSDTYLYASGDGNDEISDDVGFTDDANIDILRLTDLNLTDIALQRDGDNLLVTMAGTGQVITIDYQFLSADQNFGIERIEFADGSSLGRADLDNEFPSDPESNASFSASRMASTSAGSGSEDHVDLRPIDLAPVTFQFVSADAITSTALDQRSETASAISTDQPAETNLTFWSTASDSYTDSETVSDLRLNFDSNQDNVLDVNDARWDEFRVWRDSNANGVADSGELQSMTEAGIKLINLLPSSGSQAFSDGTTSTAYASADGSKYLIGDATFVADPLVRNANAA